MSDLCTGASASERDGERVLAPEKSAPSDVVAETAIRTVRRAASGAHVHRMRALRDFPPANVLQSVPEDAMLTDFDTPNPVRTGFAEAPQESLVDANAAAAMASAAADGPLGAAAAAPAKPKAWGDTRRPKASAVVAAFMRRYENEMVKIDPAAADAV